MDEAQVLQHAIRALDAEDISYLITGSVASSYYGEHRFTQDVDIAIWFGGDPDRAARLCARFPQPDFYVSVDAAVRAAAEGGQFNIIHNETMLKIDFMILANSLFDRGRLARRRTVEIQPKLIASIASPEDVIVKKMLYYREGGSEKHLRDITSMLRLHDGIDRDFVRSWADQFGVDDIWRTICEKVDAAGA